MTAAMKLKMLAPWKKIMTNLHRVLKSWDITFPTKVCIIKGMVFPVFMYECESWTVKKAEHWRIDAFKLWCWRKLLRVAWTARRSNQSILKKKKNKKPWIFIGRTDAEADSLATWYSRHLMRKLTHWKRPWCWERLKAGGEGDDRWWDGWMPSPTQWTWVWARSRRWWRTGKAGVLQSIGLQKVGHNWATEQQQQSLWRTVWRFPP